MQVWLREFFKNWPVYRGGENSSSCSSGLAGPAPGHGPAPCPPPRMCLSTGTRTSILPRPLPIPRLSWPCLQALAPAVPSARRPVPFQGRRQLPFPVGPVFTPFLCARPPLPQAPLSLHGGKPHKSHHPGLCLQSEIINGYHKRSQNSAKGRTQRPARSRVSPRGHRPHPVFRFVWSARPRSE